MYAGLRDAVIPTAPCSQFHPTSDALPRSTDYQKVCLQDVSRGGARFFFHEQIFPGEHLGLFLVDEISIRLLPGGPAKTAEAVWCRRLNARCFEVGVHFLDEA